MIEVEGKKRKEKEEEGGRREGGRDRELRKKSPFPTGHP